MSKTETDFYDKPSPSWDGGSWSESQDEGGHLGVKGSVDPVVVSKCFHYTDSPNPFQEMEESRIGKLCHHNGGTQYCQNISEVQLFLQVC